MNSGCEEALGFFTYIIVVLILGGLCALLGADLTIKVVAWGFGIVVIGIPLLGFLYLAFCVIKNLFKKED